MPRINSYILLDSARMEADINTARDMNKNFISLYCGKSEISLASVAPYIFTIHHKDEFENWYFDKGWGNSWGVLVYSYEDMKSLHKHFRKFLMVKTESGEELYFRFYDPRVLKIFLPTCDQPQLKEFFGPVDYFICEDENPTKALVFSLQFGELVNSQILKEQMFTFDPVIKPKQRFSFF